MSTMSQVSIALFTRDLRVHDNPVLHAASRAQRVVPLFVIDESILHTAFVRPNRDSFLTESLAALDSGLREHGGRLVMRHGDVIEQVRQVAAEVRASEIHIAADVSAYAQQRARRLQQAFAEDDCAVFVHEAVVTAVTPGEVTPAGNDHFAVFTPYYRRWKSVPKRSPLPPPRRLQLPRIRIGKVPAAGALCAGQTSPERPVGGEQRARHRLAAWEQAVQQYADTDDDLATDATSRLSPYLHFGCLSAIEILHRLDAAHPGAEAFVRQLAWRDFHHQVLDARPACSHRDYRDHGDRWRRDEQALQAWKHGRTGYPIVDAGMRQLAREGWMHNRARLITASFLTKTLYMDWRLGARHFLDLLVDGDVANNQMNWQWVAGTGTDTRPNRVLNPLSQAKRYDPRGDYVRRYVPELADIPGTAVHRPWELEPETRAKRDYPDPIVHLDEGTHRFRTARGK